MATNAIFIKKIDKMSNLASCTGYSVGGVFMKKNIVPISEKYALTVQEAAVYFNLGQGKLRQLIGENGSRIAVFSGNRYLILRKKFEDFMSHSTEI